MPAERSQTKADSDMKKSIIVEKLEKVWFIRFNLPKSMNPLVKDLRIELKQALGDFRSDHEARVAILTGSGKAFCAGGSLNEFADGMNAMEAYDFMHDVNEIIQYITSIDKPIIACVNGVAIGAGFNVALACDVIIASVNAKFAQTFSKVGLLVDMGGTYFLPRIIGIHKAKELLYTAKMLTAEEAMSMGIVNQVVSYEELESHALAFAKKIAEGPAKALAMAKTIMLKSMELSLGDVLEYEAMAQSLCMQSDDHKEGVKAFFEKRPPVFKGK
ncbi:MAG: enoyl-CoA hydratase/isomerase family protein [Desulfomonilia bacterium]|jgi:2-(1,2-epoxy-1,2-dihydrophenyl)acetyl-CoA isomerase|nr:enoyl-CoA hydratase/isomerase family protein [Desulfomonilia bacterium]